MPQRDVEEERGEKVQEVLLVDLGAKIGRRPRSQTTLLGRGPEGSLAKTASRRGCPRRPRRGPRASRRPQTRVRFREKSREGPAKTRRRESSCRVARPGRRTPASPETGRFPSHQGGRRPP